VTVTAAGTRLARRRSGSPGQAGTAHQQRHGLARHDHTLAVDELGTNPRGAVGLAGRFVHGGDLVGQPRLTDRARRGRPAAGVVEPRAGHPECQAGLLDRDALSGQFGHEGEPGFCGHHLLDRGRGLAQDLDPVLQLRDPRPGRGRRSRLDRLRRRCLQPPVEEVLGLPAMQARLCDPQRRGHVTN
jgi:hypothetical protein